MSHKSYYLLFKNLADRFFAATALLLLAPFLLIVVFLVRIFIGPKVFFVQRRPGYRSKPFS